MARPSRHILELARQGAALRVRELLNELELLLDLFPDLKDTFDPDELPVDYIMETDASREAKQAVGKQTGRPRARSQALRRQKKRGRADRGAGTK